MAMRTTFLLAFPFFCILDTAFAQDAPPPIAKHCIDSAFNGDPFSGESEKICLTELPTTKAKRAGSVLTINLENSQKKIYRDNRKACAANDAEKCITYRLVGYASLSKQFVVIKGYYESYGVELLDARTGVVTPLEKVPYFSPDQSTFIVNNEDPEGEAACSLTMGYVTQDNVKTECIYWPDEESWTVTKWIDNDHLSLEASFQSDGVPQTQEAILSRRDQSEWIWTRSLAKAVKD